MPNWVHNELTINGTKTKIDAFIKKITDTKGNVDFNLLIPAPNLKSQCDKKYICDPEKEHIQAEKGKEWFNWYEWNIDHWGTKWNACETQIYRDGNYAEISFDTAWSPADPVMDIMGSKLTNGLEIGWRAEEESGDFVWNVEWKDGKVTWSTHPNFKVDKQEKTH